MGLARRSDGELSPGPPSLIWASRLAHFHQEPRHLLQLHLVSCCCKADRPAGSFPKCPQELGRARRNPGASNSGPQAHTPAPAAPRHALGSRDARTRTRHSDPGCGVQRGTPGCVPDIHPTAVHCSRGMETAQSLSTPWNMSQSPKAMKGRHLLQP